MKLLPRIGVWLLIGIAAAGALIELPHASRSKIDWLVTKMDIPELTAESDIIGRVTVEKKLGTVRVADAAGEDMVYTRWLLKVNSPIKGSARSVIVRTGGGQYLSTFVDVEDEVKLVKGQDLFVFLEKDRQSGDHYFTGLGQGVYTVQGSTVTDAAAHQLRGMTDLTEQVKSLIKS